MKSYELQQLYIKKRESKTTTRQGQTKTQAITPNQHKQQLHIVKEPKKSKKPRENKAASWRTPRLPLSRQLITFRTSGEDSGSLRLAGLTTICLVASTTCFTTRYWLSS